MTDIWKMGACELAGSIRDGKVSCREAVDDCLARIEAVNARVNAITGIFAEEAREAAAKADQLLADGAQVGPLHGVPFTVKENIDLKGHATTQGVQALQDLIAPEDAPIVAQLRAAGAIPVASTNLPDFGLRWYTESMLHGATVNPWDPARTPGGSSGGAAAALATGMGPLALGNDLGGSLRYPAQCCGIASIRPSLGRIARASANLPAEHPFSFQLMYVEGPMARKVEDLRAALKVTSGYDSRDPWWVPAPFGPDMPEENIRVALTVNPGDMGVDPQVAEGVRRAGECLSRAGYIVEEAEPPLVAEAADFWRGLVFSELKTFQIALLRQVASEKAIRSLELNYSFIKDFDMPAYMSALAERTRVYREWLMFLERYPLIIGPVSTSPPFPVDGDVLGTEESRIIMDSQRLLLAINFLGLPSAVAPVGLSQGLPQAVQIIGGPFQEMRCLAAAEALEKDIGCLTPIEPVETEGDE